MKCVLSILLGVFLAGAAAANPIRKGSANKACRILRRRGFRSISEQVSPYLLTSVGSYLVLTEHGEETLESLKNAGVPAVRIGFVKEQNARTLVNGEETRYLDRPAPDELSRWWKERKESEEQEDRRGDNYVSGEASYIQKVGKYYYLFTICFWRKSSPSTLTKIFWTKKDGCNWKNRIR